jgi:superfamily II DNA/RNA helicase
LADAKTSPLGMSSATSDCEVGLKHGEMLLVSTNGLFKAFAELKIDIDEFLRENAVSAKKCRDRIVDELGRLLKSGFSDDITFLIAGFDDDNDKKN